MNTLFDFETPAPVAAPPIPPTPPKPVALAEPLGVCCKVGCDNPATVASPSGDPQSIYCKACGRCGAKSVEMTALGVSVKVCGNSVEQFVLHPRMGIWCCPCMLSQEAS
jgi:hypothetical protein